MEDGSSFSDEDVKATGTVCVDEDLGSDDRDNNETRVSNQRDDIGNDGTSETALPLEVSTIGERSVERPDMSDMKFLARPATLSSVSRERSKMRAWNPTHATSENRFSELARSRDCMLLTNRVANMTYGLPSRAINFESICMEIDAGVINQESSDCSPLSTDGIPIPLNSSSPLPLSSGEKSNQSKDEHVLSHGVGLAFVENEKMEWHRSSSSQLSERTRGGSGGGGGAAAAVVVDEEIPVEMTQFTYLGAPDSKYEVYHCMIDRMQNDRSVEIQLVSLERPHMRAFHLAWMSFFVAFFTWFAITPLLTEVQRTLNLSKREIWTSSMFAVGSSALTRVLIGPLCDKYGARIAMAGTLIMSAVPTALTGLVQSAMGLNLLRLSVGVAGSSFVTCQYWTSTMFTVEVAGTANALVAGWGNLGGGVTQVVMGSLLFPLFKVFFGGGWGDSENFKDGSTTDRSAELAWRSVCVVPAMMCFVMAYVVMCHSDDSPKGNYNKRSREGFIPEVSAGRALFRACSNLNTWLLFMQYGCCFGVEITMVNAAALYFKEIFGLSTEEAAAIASVFGWVNIFARGAGGFISDIANASYGMRGRLWTQVFALLAEGGLVIAFAQTQSLGWAIFVMIVLSTFVQTAEGSTFGIVPYVSPSITGSVSGFVGAGGNIGGVAFALLFRDFNYRDAFRTMGFVVMGSAFLSFLVSIQGLASLCGGQDAPEVLERRSNRIEQFGNLPNVSIEDPDSSARDSRSSGDGKSPSERITIDSNRGQVLETRANPAP